MPACARRSPRWSTPRPAAGSRPQPARSGRPESAGHPVARSDDQELRGERGAVHPVAPARAADRHDRRELTVAQYPGAGDPRLVTRFAADPAEVQLTVSLYLLGLAV